MYLRRSGVLTALAWLVPHETAAVSAQVLCTPYNHAPSHFMQSHIRKVYACLAVTCHLHFWQNDRDLLRAAAVTRGWNGYRNKVSTESRPWRRKFSRRSCRDSNPRPFSHDSGAPTTELFPRVRVPAECECMCLHQSVCGTVCTRSNGLLTFRASLSGTFLQTLVRFGYATEGALYLEGRMS